MRLGNPNGAAALRRAGKGNRDALKVIPEGADGYAQELAPIIAEIRANVGTSLPVIAQALNERHIQTRRGGLWYPSSVSVTCLRDYLRRPEGSRGRYPAFNLNVLL
jgi:hypothetical protein